MDKRKTPRIQKGRTLRPAMQAQRKTKRTPKDKKKRFNLIGEDRRPNMMKKMKIVAKVTLSRETRAPRELSTNTEILKK